MDADLVDATKTVLEARSVPREEIEQLSPAYRRLFVQVRDDIEMERGSGPAGPEERDTPRREAGSQ